MYFIIVSKILKNLHTQCTSKKSFFINQQSVGSSVGLSICKANKVSGVPSAVYQDRFISDTLKDTVLHHEPVALFVSGYKGS